jgi:hypothetical protein
MNLLLFEDGGAAALFAGAAEVCVLSVSGVSGIKNWAGNCAMLNKTTNRRGAIYFIIVFIFPLLLSEQGLLICWH